MDKQYVFRRCASAPFINENNCLYRLRAVTGRSGVKNADMQRSYMQRQDHSIDPDFGIWRDWG